MISDIEHLFMASWLFVYVLEKCLIKSFAHFSIELFGFSGVLIIFQAAAHVFSASGSTAIPLPFLLLTKLLESFSPIYPPSVNV